MEIALLPPRIGGKTERMRGGKKPSSFPSFNARLIYQAYTRQGKREEEEKEEKDKKKGYACPVGYLYVSEPTRETYQLGRGEKTGEERNKRPLYPCKIEQLYKKKVERKSKDWREGDATPRILIEVKFIPNEFPAWRMIK